MNKNCVICQVPLEGLKHYGRRVVCMKFECTRAHKKQKMKKAYERYKEKLKDGVIPGRRIKDNTLPKYGGARRRQGFFLIPDRQVELLYHGPKDFFCQCGLKVPVANDLRIECDCGAVWTISFGTSDSHGIYIVSINRWR